MMAIIRIDKNNKDQSTSEDPSHINPPRIQSEELWRGNSSSTQSKSFGTKAFIGNNCWDCLNLEHVKRTSWPIFCIGANTFALSEKNSSPADYHCPMRALPAFQSSCLWKCKKCSNAKCLNKKSATNVFSSKIKANWAHIIVRDFA